MADPRAPTRFSCDLGRARGSSFVSRLALVLVSTSCAPATAPARPAAIANTVATTCASAVSPFTLERGDPRPRFHAYAIERWGPGGDNTFDRSTESPGLRFYDVGRYAVIDLVGQDQFVYRDLGEHAWVNSMTVKAVTGTDARDVVVRYTVKDPNTHQDWERWNAHPDRLPDVTDVTRTVVEVWSLADPRAPQVVFAQEVGAWANCCGSEVSVAPPHVEADLELGVREIRLRANAAWRANADSWHEHPLADIPAVVPPWAATTTRTFRWSECGFRAP
jgi:hypothetical protein